MNRTLLWAPDGSTVIEFAERPGVAFQISKEEIGRGASCIVYHAVSSDHTEHLLKEYYPKHLRLSRDSSGRLIVPEDQLEAFEQGLARFRTGCDRQKDIRLSNESLKNFTCNVQGYYQANGTEYIDMTCFSGLTYDHVQEKTVYSLMLRMRTLAQVVGNYHKAGLLHLDIKPENIYVRPEDETVEDVMLFDFDSATPVNELGTSKALSCTKAWAAPEQLLSERHRCICYATDLFAIGEIIFVQLFGRHSTSAERRSFVSRYPYDRNAEIFKDMNPKVFPLLDELLCNTICGVVSKRYQTADELIAKLDEIIALATPEKPYLKSSPMTMQDFFIGRDNEIAEIHQKLNENRILFLSGIGGIGKSELSKHYAVKYNESYDVIVFASYLGDVNMLLQNDIAIPLYHFSRYPEEKPQEYCNRKLRKLQELCDERTLFIVDNLDRDDDPDLKKLLELNCKLLVTTRIDFSEYGLGQQLSLDVLQSRQEIRAIFDKHYTKALTQEENDCVEQIIDLVAGHTMTVELLAKQMMAGRVKPGKMLAKLQEGGISESGTEKVRSGKDGTLSAQSTYDHIQMLFDLSELNEKERYILANLSLIPYSGIPTELFHDWCELEDYDGITKLVTEGWVRLDKERDYISLHPVIADVVSDWAQSVPQIWEIYLCSLEAHLNDWIDYPSAIKIKIEECARLVVVRFGKLHVATESIAVILKDVGEFYAQSLYRYDLALEAMRLANEKREFYGDDGVEFKTALQCNLGVIYDSLGTIKNNPELTKTAIRLYEKCLELYSHFDADLLNIEITSQNLACAYDNIGMYALAESAFNKANEILNELTKSRGNTKEVACEGATLYNNIALHYKLMQSYEKALKNLKISYTYALLLGDRTERIAKIYHDLAAIILLQENGNIDQAIEYAEKSLKIRKEIFLSDSYYTAMSKYVLAKCYIRTEQIENLIKARSLLERAKPIFVNTLGEAHEDTMELVALLSEIERDLQFYKN